MKIINLKDKIDYIDDIVLLEKENFFNEHYSKKMLEDMIDNDLYEIDILLDEKTFVGYIIYMITDVCEIFKILTVKKCRRKGNAKMLLDNMIEKIRKKNIKRILLEVREDNIEANSFYIKNNFKTIYVRKNYYKEPQCNANVMEKIL